MEFPTEREKEPDSFPKQTEHSRETPSRQKTGPTTEAPLARRMGYWKVHWTLEGKACPKVKEKEMPWVAPLAAW